MCKFWLLCNSFWFHCKKATKTKRAEKFTVLVIAFQVILGDSGFASYLLCYSDKSREDVEAYNWTLKSLIEMGDT